MGSWGYGLFENDEALAWLRNVELEGWDALDSVLEEEESEDHLDAAEGAAALVAAALIAQLAERHPRPMPSVAGAALRKLQADRLALKGLDEWRVRALLAVTRVLDDESDLRAMREENGDGQEWCALVEELRDRLT
jgi:hypothetical protein